MIGRVALGLTLACSVLAPAACSSKDASVPAKNANEIRFDTAPYTLQAGQEKYFCYTMTLPTDHDTVITSYTPVYGKGVHHFAFFYTIAPEPDGFSECPVLIKTTWIPLYGGGKDSGPLTLPAGAGARLRGQQVLIQLHMVNSTKDTITDKSAMVMTTADPASKTVNAGLFGVDNRAIEIPPKSATYEVSMDCKVDKDMEVFAVLGHMHTRGSNIQLSRGAKAGDEILYEAKWNFDVQPTTPLKVALKAGDMVHLRCQWDNQTDKTIKYGESTFDEMCAFVWYYTPYDRLNGCVKLPPS